MAEGPPLVDLSEIDSAFQLTEHLKALHNFLTHPVGLNSTTPVDREMALKLAQAPDNVDRTLWLYELCRFLTQKVNSIIVALFSDNPACSSTTCPEMRASEWQYLCAVHDPPKSCCAIDYCCHTLDWAANTLTSPKHFPSRLALGADQSTQHSQMRQLTNIFRRVYRVFAHAWFQHQDMFWKVECRTGLYVFFKTVCDVYGLIPEDNYTIPPQAEGIEPPSESRSTIPPFILKRTQDERSNSIADGPSVSGEGEGDHTLSTAGTTKRHRHSPSVGATSVSTVVEENEEEEDDGLNQKQGLTELPESAIPEDDITVLEDNTVSQSEEESTKEASTAASGVAQSSGDNEETSQSKSEQDSTSAKDEVSEPISTETSDAAVPVSDVSKEASVADAEPEADQSKAIPSSTEDETVKEDPEKDSNAPADTAEAEAEPEKSEKPSSTAAVDDKAGDEKKTGE